MAEPSTRKPWQWKAVFALLLLVAVLALLPESKQRVRFTPAQQRCFQGRAKEQAYSYCIHVPANGPSNDGLVYYFHGRDGDAKEWNDDDFFTGQVQAYWQAHGIVPPTVVSVSFGPSWLMMRHTDNPQSGALDTFAQEIVPAVERRLGTPRYRVLFGASMGGFNALLAALQLPKAAERTIALCPPIYRLAPRPSLAELYTHARHTGADWRKLLGLWWLGRSYVQSESDAEALGLFALLEKAAPADVPALYLSCGLYDPYGNYEGTRAFAQRAAERGLEVEWRPLYGGHCAVDIASVARALAESPAP